MFEGAHRCAAPAAASRGRAASRATAGKPSLAVRCLLRPARSGRAAHEDGLTRRIAHRGRERLPQRSGLAVRVGLTAFDGATASSVSRVLVRFGHAASIAIAMLELEALPCARRRIVAAEGQPSSSGSLQACGCTSWQWQPGTPLGDERARRRRESTARPHAPAAMKTPPISAPEGRDPRGLRS